MSINLHIERLILDGLSENRSQGSLIGAAVETELARLLATHPLESSLQPDGARPTVPSNAIHLTANQPAHVGQQIAQAVYRGIGPTQL
jgi:hypothetical protein